MRIDSLLKARPVVAAWLTSLLLTLVSVATALADGTGTQYPR